MSHQSEILQFLIDSIGCEFCTLPVTEGIDVVLFRVRLGIPRRSPRQMKRVKVLTFSKQPAKQEGISVECKPAARQQYELHSEHV